MGIIRELFGHSNDKNGIAGARTVAEAEAALARLAKERTATSVAIVRAVAERDELLLVDGSEAAMAALETAADSHRLMLERLDRLEPVLLARLQELRDADHRARWTVLQKKFDSVSLEFIAAARKAFALYKLSSEIRSECQISGFASEAASALPVVPAHLAGELIDAFEIELERRREAMAPRRESVPFLPHHSASAAHAKAAKATPGARLAPVSVVSPAPLPRVPRRLIASVPPCHIAVRFLRSGVEVDGEVMGTGDTIAVPEAQARSLVQNSAAVFVNEEVKS